MYLYIGCVLWRSFFRITQNYSIKTQRVAPKNSESLKKFSEKILKLSEFFWKKSDIFGKRLGDFASQPVLERIGHGYSCSKNSEIKAPPSPLSRQKCSPYGKMMKNDSQK